MSFSESKELIIAKQDKVSAGYRGIEGGSDSLGIVHTFDASALRLSTERGCNAPRGVVLTCQHMAEERRRFIVAAV